ncbi:MAG: ATP-dependent RecD-like DNA helicase [Planctomycetes bacterium]|nr:ATP-dependent RecD-like DNA helicase [Planctomycetota bacterium]
MQTDAELKTYEGTLQHVVYTNEQNHWSVARLKVSDSDRSLTIVGIIPGLQPGEQLRVTGREVIHGRFGPQFQVESFQPIVPTTEDGIRRYLASGVLSGMGKVLAERIVEAFGIDTLRVIDETPQRLLEIEGIGRKKLKKILKSWGAGRAARETLVFLRGHGFGPVLAARVYEQYGARAVTIAREQPYRLARDVAGVGFVIADRMARSLGVAEDDPDRLAAGLRHVLAAQVQEGHVAYPWASLVEQGVRLLGVDPLLVDAALAELERDRQVRVEAAGEPHERLVYLPHLHAAEVEVAERLAALARGRSVLGARIHEFLPGVRTAAGISLTEEQLDAVQLALSHRVSVITGGPGVGKTTIVRAIVSVCRRMGLRVELAAPTGRAAKRLTEATGMGARTIHRLLEFDPGTGSFARGPGRPLDAELVLIDETSMVDLLLARDLLAALPPTAGLVLIGDADQLPSVGPGRVLGDLLDSGVFQSCRLVRVFRQQEGGKIIENAHRINRGELPETSHTDEADFYLVQREDPAAILALVEELVTKRIPRRFGLRPDRDIQVLTPMYRGVVGADNLNARLQALINPGESVLVRGSLALRPGDRVMQLVNDYEKGVFNGDVGTVVRILEGDRITVEIDGAPVEYEAADLDDLTLAYAVTVHKAQGSEYPAVVVPLTATHWPLLQRNLLYTAVTRGKKLVVLVGERRALERAVRNDRIRTRHGRLLARLREAANRPPGGGAG